MTISAKKQRYSVTLTPANVDRFQTLCKRLGLPPSTMSNAFDETINSISDTFQMALDKGTIEISDLFSLMGKQMELLHQEERKENGNKKRESAKVERKAGAKP